MLIFNETFIIDDAIAEEWLAWIKNNHIPAVLATGGFDGYKLYTILDSPNEGITYCLQFNTDNVERYSEFYYKQMEGIHAEHNKQFEERFALFYTLMESIDL
jgi:hypothetical protein